MNELKELEDEADKFAQQIQWNEEWIRLSIVEKTALMNAVKNYPKFVISGSCTGGLSHGLLEDAHTLFMKMKKDNEWHHRNLKNNHKPYQTDLKKRIQALKLELRTPEQVAEAEEAERRRIARLEMYSGVKV
ncbi:hypothetical protein N9X64_00085 [bacterium]|nr:hypothetical protein [bacterium]